MADKKNGSSMLKHHIPNVITCLNLFCGCLSIVSTFSGRMDLAVYFILVAAVFDFFDGFAARFLNAYSELGKQLDSLADMVSFGVAPASIMYNLLLTAATKPGIYENFFPFGLLIPLLAYLIAVFSALRLAKFNIDTRQTDSFIGLPTPANALFICSLAFMSISDSPLPWLTDSMFFLLAVTFLFSYLLIAELPLFSLKFKSFDWKRNKIKYVFVSISALLLLFFHWAGLSFVILLYIIISIITNKNKNRQSKIIN